MFCREGDKIVGMLSETIRSIESSRKFGLLAFILIAGMILAAYSNTFTASFHFDDDAAIAENPGIKRATTDNILTLLKGARPVVSLSLMLNYQLSGLNVIGWHIFNIAFHIMNSYLVYLLLLVTFTLPSLAGRYSNSARRMALFGALLFGVHPIQTESVTYIISRSELLATFFYLSTFLLFIRGTLSKSVLFHGAALVTAILAVSSKEWAVTLPALLFIYDLLFLSGGRLKGVVAHWKGYLLVLVSWVPLFYSISLTASTNSTIGFNMPEAGTGPQLTAYTYLLTSANVIWTYIRLLFLPINQNLDYDYPIATTLLQFPTLLSFVGHVAVIVCAFWLYRKKGSLLVPFGVAWFYIGLSPVQSFVPIRDVIFEHRLYMPSIGFFIAFIAGYEAYFGWLESRSARRTDPSGQQAEAR